MSSHTGSDRAEGILSTLSEWQFLRPHRPLRDVVEDAVTRLGLCPDAARRALAWLEVDDAQPVGRLRATELTQLARCMARLWEQATSTSAANPVLPHQA